MKRIRNHTIHLNAQGRKNIPGGTFHVQIDVQTQATRCVGAVVEAVGFALADPRRAVKMLSPPEALRGSTLAVY